MNPKAFANRIHSIADKLPARTSATASEAALRILTVLVPATPVDTGRARGNWQTSIGSPIYKETTRLDPAGVAEISKAKSLLATKPIGATVYITNNLDYIESLNDGSSAQAPAGFVQRAIAIAIQGIRNIRILR